jgi:REP element-mobilizing transposase RayT
MARKKRCIIAGFCYHVMLRGTGGQDIFRDKEDYVRFCLLLQYASEMYDLQVLGFCFMGNHFHLIIQPQHKDLSSGMHALAFRYAQYFNNKYNRQGHLYQGRYKAILVQTGIYLRRLVRYVHLNPVRAGMVYQPEGYIWSSYRAYIGQETYTWLNTGIVFDAFGETSSAQEKLIEYTLMDDENARAEVYEIRKSLQIGAYGDDEFLEKWLPKQIVNYKPNVILEHAVATVCSHLQVSLEEIRSDKRKPSLIFARTLLACLIQQFKSGSMVALASYILRDPSSLAKLAKKGEFDPQVQIIKEALLAQLATNARMEGQAPHCALPSIALL